MNDAPQALLEHLISEGQHLLDAYSQSKAALKNPETDLGETVWSEIAGVIAGDLLESKRIGGKARRFAKESMAVSRKEKLRELEEGLNRKVQSWISRSVDILKTISTESSTSPDSQKIVTKFLKAQRYVKPETKLKHGTSILREILLRGVIKSDEIVSARAELVAGPDAQFNAYNEILLIARQAKGYLVVVDPYPSRETLFVLQECPLGLSVKLLTNPPPGNDNRTEFEILANKLMKDRPSIKIRYAPSRTLHDRFMFTETAAWHIGHSIKDIGNKLSAITPMSPKAKKKLEDEFNLLWKQATRV